MPRLVARITTPRMQMSPRRGVIFWRPVRQMHNGVECALCDEGICYQRIEWGKGWDGRLVVHGHLPN